MNIVLGFCSANVLSSTIASHFDSPGLKAQVRFSDRQSSVYPSVCKLFIFSSSSPELLGQFQQYLAQNIFY